MTSTHRPGDTALLAAYHHRFGLADATCTIDDVRHHLDLERRLTEEMLAAPEDTRVEVFAACYERLYVELPWLTAVQSSCEPRRWARLLGDPPARVYEVGSGAGDLARGLADAGYDVVATDLSGSRGDRREHATLRWSATDGVHLTRFADPQSFDAVISSQVLEHLHPDDVPVHFAEAYRLLRPGGRYVFQTPHVLTGPHDVSRVVDADVAWGMHLREYDNRTLAAVARDTGFGRVRSVVQLPRVARCTAASSLHLRCQEWLEGRSLLRSRRARGALRRLRAPLRPDVWLVAEKP